MLSNVPPGTDVRLMKSLLEKKGTRRRRFCVTFLPPGLPKNWTTSLSIDSGSGDLRPLQTEGNGKRRARKNSLKMNLSPYRRNLGILFHHEGGNVRETLDLFS